MKILIRLVLLMINIICFTIAVEDFDKRCLRNCPLIFDPICGSDGKNFRLFGSKCVMESENCNHIVNNRNTYTKIPLKFCNYDENINGVHCPKLCPLLFGPVCASNNKTTKMFMNRCELRLAQCKKNEAWIEVKIDACNNKIPEDDDEKIRKNNCLRDCQLNWDPICGFDGEKYYTFGNKCDMEVQICIMNEKKWKIIRKGQCD